jgi:hypothetical protein
MRLTISTLAILLATLFMNGCTNNAERLGEHVAKLRTEQVYNTSASQENLGVVPTGSGERMEGAYQVYTGKQDKDLSSTDSQFLDGFTN